MKRPLVPVSLSLIAGIILGEIFNFFPITAIVIITLFILIGSILVRYYPIPLSNLLFFIMITGMVYYQYSSNRIPMDDISHLNDRGVFTITGEVFAPARHYEDRAQIIINAKEVEDESGIRQVSGYLRVTIYGKDPAIQYGDVIRADVKPRRPNSFKNPGSFDYERYLSRRGIRSVANIRSQDIKKIGEGGWRILRYIYSIRNEVRVRAKGSLDKYLYPIFMAMIIGETGYLTNEIRDDFMYSGTTHILSISGSHLALVTFFIFNLVRIALLYLPSRLLLRMGEYIIPSKAAAAATMMPLIFYTLITGSEVATVRSLVMAMIYLIAVLIEREDDILNALAFAAMAILIWDPNALWDISFQLSFVSVLYIGLILKHWSEWRGGSDKGHEEPSLWKKIGSSLLLYLMISAGAMIGTAPLVIYYFHQFSWVGILANLIVVPLVGILVLPLGLVSSFFTYLFGSSGFVFSALNNIALLIFYRTVQFFASIPFSDIHLSLSLSSVILLSLLLILSTGSPRSVRGWRSSFVAASLIFIFIFESGPIYDKRGNIRVTYLDIGQGDSSLIEFPGGKVMIVDGGGQFGGLDLGRAVVAPYLWERGIRRIDYLVSTHPQLDHMGGLNYIIERFKIGEIWTNGTSRDTDFYRRFRHLIDVKGLTVRYPKRGMETDIYDDCRISALNPPDGQITDKLNNSSIVLRIFCNGISFIFSGDIERKIEKDIVSLGSGFQGDIIKVPHHGSKGSLDYSFIAGVNPKVAVISVGRHNQYGHPAEEVMNAYKDIGAAVLRTDMDGAVSIKKTKDAFRIRRYIDLIPKKVEIGREVFTDESENIKRLFLDF